MINYCESCGQGRDGNPVGLYIELDDNGLCQECREMFCPICNQSLNTDDAGYCYNCKEPVVDVVFTGKVFDYLK